MRTGAKRLGRWLSAPWVGWLLGLSLGGLLLWLAAREVNLADVAHVLGKADPLWVAAALVCVLLSILFRSLRWQILLLPGHPMSDRLPHSLLLPSLLVGQLLNAVAPTRLGDLSRAYVVGQVGVSRSFVLGTVVMEKIFDAAAFGFILLLLLALAPLPAWARPAVFSFFGAMAVLLAVLLVVGLNRWRLLGWLDAANVPLLPAHWQDSLSRRLAAGMVSLDVLRAPSTVVGLLIWSLLVWGAGAAINYLLFLALDMALPVSAALLLLIVLQVSTTLPPSPGNIGIFEGLCVFALAVFGVDRTMGLSYGLLLHAVVFLPTVLLGMLSLGRLGLWGKQLVATPNHLESIETMIVSEAVLAQDGETADKDNLWKDR